jgi:Cu(I)/Ag(I) efflux system membrane fusion protein
VPGAVFEGQVQALLPEVNATTRTIKARLELANPAGSSWCPACSSHAVHGHARGEGVAGADRGGDPDRPAHRGDGRRGGTGASAPVDVETGIESGGQTEIKRGLQAGQRWSSRRSS